MDSGVGATGARDAESGAASVGAPTHAMSIDVEEYFQVSAFESAIERHEWDTWPSRVEQEIDTLLELFERRQTRATFFTLGWIAERHPQMVRRIDAAGHEVACHGYQHVRITNQTPSELREDLRLSKAILEDVIGRAVAGYRAASFSINQQNLWAFEEIEAAGFDYSSSVYPVRHDLYGIPDAPRVPFRPSGVTRLVEIPVTTARVGARNVPAGGGGYFRLFPYHLSRALLRRVTQREGLHANMYFHPWEFDPGQPRPPGMSARTRFRHYLNQTRSLERLERLLGDFRWGRFCDVYDDTINGRAALATCAL